MASGVAPSLAVGGVWNEIDRLRGDPNFEREEVARGFGPPPGPEGIDDSAEVVSGLEPAG